MSEYIEREAALALADNRMRKILLALPAADVRPVVRGKWRERRFSGNVYGAECSVCHTTWDCGTNFCPNCGAVMEGS